MSEVETVSTETHETDSSNPDGDSDGFETELSEDGSEISEDGSDDAPEVQAKEQTKKPGAKKETSEDLIKKFLGEDEEEQGGEDEEQSDDSDPVLKSINDLKFTHEGEEFSVASKDELKTLVQQGKDYTKKTQAVAQEKKEFETLKAKAYEEYNSTIADLNKSVEAHQQQLQQYQIWDLTLAQIKQDDPDLYEDLIQRSKQSSKHFDNPILDARFKALDEKYAKLEGQHKARESELIQRQFESQYAEQATAIAQLEKELGFKVDKEKVYEEWRATGGTAAKAVGALYGEKILKLKASKDKVNTVKAQVGKTGGGGAIRRSSAAAASASKKPKIDFSKSDSEVTDQLVAMLG